MKYLAMLLGIVFLGGCISRTYTVEKPRTNLEIHGNQGYLFGTPKEESKPNKFGETRKISVLEVELGAHPRKKAKKEEVKPQEEIISEDEEFTEEEPMLEGSPTTPGENYELYTVQKNDTLQKISEKFYGTTKKWKMIYDKNRDVLKSPDRVYPGKTIKIPMLDNKAHSSEYK